MQLLWNFWICKHGNTCSSKTALKRETETARTVKRVLFKGLVSDICAPTVGFFSHLISISLHFPKKSVWTGFTEVGGEGKDLRFNLVTSPPPWLCSDFRFLSVTLPYPPSARSLSASPPGEGHWTGDFSTIVFLDRKAAVMDVPVYYRKRVQKLIQEKTAEYSSSQLVQSGSLGMNTRSIYHFYYFFYFIEEISATFTGAVYCSEPLFRKYVLRCV